MAVLYDRVHSTVEAIDSCDDWLETWRIIPFSKWFSNHGYSSKSPIPGVVPLPNSLTGMILQEVALLGPVYHPSPCRRGCLYWRPQRWLSRFGILGISRWFQRFVKNQTNRNKVGDVLSFECIDVYTYLHKICRECRDIDTESMHPPIFGTIPSVVGQELVQWFGKVWKWRKIPSFLPHFPCDSEMFPSGDLHHFVGHCAVDQGPDVSVPSPVEAARVFNVIKSDGKMWSKHLWFEG